jgi:hypothetical protein
MGQDERIVDQGRGARSIDEQCPPHLAVVKDIARHENNITDLYDKHNETRELLHGIKISITKLAGSVESGFQIANGSVRSLTDEIAKIVTQRDGFAADYYTEMKKLKDEIAILKEQSWLGAGLTRWRDRLPWIFMSFILFLIAVITFFHRSDVGKVVENKILKGG